MNCGGVSQSLNAIRQKYGRGRKCTIIIRVVPNVQLFRAFLYIKTRSHRKRETCVGWSEGHEKRWLDYSAREIIIKPGEPSFPQLSLYRFYMALWDPSLFSKSFVDIDTHRRNHYSSCFHSLTRSLPTNFPFTAFFHVSSSSSSSPPPSPYMKSCR